MRRYKQEWDYPPRQRRYRTYNVLDAVPDGEGWSSPATTSVVDVYWRGIKFIVKVVLGAALGAFLIGCIWLFTTLVSS